METSFAPYAPPSAVMDVINHYRKRDVPERIALVNLQQIGVTEGLAPRTMAALRFLGLMREDGTTTDQFRAIRYATDEDFKTVFQGILQAAYKGVFDHVDLATAGEREISNAFIPYSPGGQRSRMITLFLALVKEAGWNPTVQAKASSPRRVSGSPKVAKTPPKVKPRKIEEQIGNVNGTGEQNAKIVNQPTVSGLQFGVTDADLMSLPPEDFDTVWSALGKIQKARAASMRALQEMSDQAAKRVKDEAGPE